MCCCMYVYNYGTWSSMACTLYYLTKQNDIQVVGVVLAESKEPCLVSKKCVLVTSKLTDVIDNKYIPSLNMTQCGEPLAVEELHCLLKVKPTCALNVYHNLDSYEGMKGERERERERLTSSICLPYRATFSGGIPLLRRAYFFDHSTKGFSTCLQKPGGRGRRGRERIGRKEGAGEGWTEERRERESVCTLA